MAVNKYIPHIYIIPEDDANRQIAIGFEKDDRIRGRSFQILAPAGGWSKALEKLEDDYFELLAANVNSHVLVLIDSDADPDRIKNAMARVPTEIQDRVFIIGTWSEPEALKKSLSISLETIGEMVAAECFDSNQRIWQHDQLKHNATEVARLKSALFEFVFSGR